MAVALAPTALPITGEGLTLDDVRAVARDRLPVAVAPAALARMARTRRVVEDALGRDEAVYGLNTGLGSLARRRIPPGGLDRFAALTVGDATAPAGDELPTDAVRAMVLARLNGLATGAAGVRPRLALALAALLDAGVHPVVHHRGSIGQGDLAENADVGRVLLGGGTAEVAGRRLPGRDALRAAGLEPLALAPREALALVAANSLSCGLGALVLGDAAVALEGLHAAAALSLEGFAANLSILHPQVARVRRHPGHAAVAARLSGLLQGSDGWGAARNLQDPLSFRCVPQVHGAAHDALAAARAACERELNSAGDNPLVVLDEGRIVSAGNFESVDLALALDTLRLALAQAVAMANERVQKLLWAQFSGLPTALADGSGERGGLRALGRAYAALAAEARDLARPVGLDYRGQVAEGVEDHASLAPLAARRTQQLLAAVARLAALELVVAAQAVDLREGRRLGRGTAELLGRVRARVEHLRDETAWRADLDGLARDVADGLLPPGPPLARG